jgi:transketolase
MQASTRPSVANLDAAIQTKMADAIRVLAADAVQKANSGHPGMPMGMADVATVLFSQFLHFDPKHPKWPNRDRFILSAGHGSMLLYSLLYLTGYNDITLDELKNFRQLGAKTAGHPEYGHAEGIETTTGPLGQGLANAVGFALAEAMQEARFGSELVDHYTYVIAGDGCLMEGISQEAISFAGHLRLRKLIVLFDDNKISIDGPTELSTSEDHTGRFEACGWDVQEIDGHDKEAIAKAIAKAKTTKTPSLIACRTTIAFGAPTKAGTSSSHGSPLGDEEIKGVRKNLGWNHAPFEIPADVLSAWRLVGKKGEALSQAWQVQFKKLTPAQQQLFEGNLPKDLDATVQSYKETLVKTNPKWATRKASGEVLKTLISHIPALVGGSADLTGSNLTKVEPMTAVRPGDYRGSYIYYGIREHAMAACMNGMALHGGFIPYGGTFLVFSDYCRPAIRLSALMGIRVVYVLTHDSIGLGEDGPTHQPVEHLAALRAIPNLVVFRPADPVETLECWQLALQMEKTPSVLALTRQEVPLLRQAEKENKCAKGAYILAEATGDLKVTIFATGSEVLLAMLAKAKLEAQKIGTRVVSVPSMELLRKQPQEYQVSLFCNSSIKVVVEAAIRQSWEGFMGPHGIFIGMESFGASGPAEELYRHFGITDDAIVTRVLQKVESRKQHDSTHSN